MNHGGRRPGAGRKPTGRRKVQFTITLKEEALTELKKRAADSRLTPGEFVTKYLSLDLHAEDKAQG